MDQNAKQQVIDRLKDATNVLVTVSTNPSVDQLSACIGFTLLINKMNKHGTAVFSGQPPSTIEFLQPEKTLEKNTDSLRDFIISLDKSKADKLRYKVEDKVVKIFITPYKTSIDDKDLEFSQGDFNVDVVLALGVHERQELDQAIVAHGRILHDATVVSVNNRDQGNLGSINWVDLQASSLSEMMADLSDNLIEEAFDEQMATAFMTGIVAETERFRNDKTTPKTMNIASALMGAGANQQLIASKLEKPKPDDEKKPLPSATKDKDDQADKDASKEDDGTLRIVHDEPAEDEKPIQDEKPAQDEKKPEKPADAEPAPAEKPQQAPQPAEPPKPELGKAKAGGQDENPSKLRGSTSVTLDPPQLGGRFTANSEPEHLQLDPATDPLSLPSVKNNSNPVLSHTPAPGTKQPSPPANTAPQVSADTTLSNIEKSVASPHAQAGNKPQEEESAPASATKPEETREERIEEAHEAVDEAIKESDPDKNLEPIQALGAQQGPDLHGDNGNDQAANTNSQSGGSGFPTPPSMPPKPPAQGTVSNNMPSFVSNPNNAPSAAGTDFPTPPPPVPPPMTPPPPQSQQ